MQGRTVQVSTERQPIINKDVFSCRRKNVDADFRM
jgi:hypothetical protein